MQKEGFKAFNKNMTNQYGLQFEEGNLFFAFCMGDAGYGLVLIALGFILKRKMSKSMKGMMNLVISPRSSAASFFSMLPRLGPKRNPFVSSKPPAAQKPCALLKEKSLERRTAKRTRLFPRPSSGRTPIRREESAGAALPRAARSPPLSAGPQSAQNRGGRTDTARALCPASLPPPCTPLSGSLVPLHGVPHAQQAFFHNGAGHGQIQPHKACGAAHKQAVAALPKGTHQRYLFSAFQQGFARRAEIERLPGAAPAFVISSQSHKAVRGLR